MEAKEKNDHLKIVEVSSFKDPSSEIPTIGPYIFIPPSDSHRPDASDIVVDLSNLPEDKPSGFLFYLGYFSQIFLPYLLSGVGSCITGLYLNYLQSWAVFILVPQLFILMPPLLNLNGNLVVTMASRLSTAASLGRLDSPNKLKALWGNLSLVLCFGILIGLLTTICTLVISSFQGGFTMDHAVIVAATGLGAVIVASLILSILAMIIVFTSLHFGINPDNISASIVSVLGDITMQLSVSMIACMMHYLEDSRHRFMTCSSIYLVALGILLVTFYTAYHNTFTRTTLKTGWCALIVSTIFTTGGGLVLQTSVASYKELAIFQPGLAGLGGNLISVHASRIATSVQQLSPDKVKIWTSPIDVFFKNTLDSHAAKMLVIMILFGHSTNAYILHFISGQATVLGRSSMFLAFYLGAAFIQVSVLIYLGTLIVRALWRFAFSPDDSAIPLLVAMADLLGTSLLLLAFHLFYHFYPKL